MMKHYIVAANNQDVEILSPLDENSTVWMVIAVDENGASIVDSNYRSLRSVRRAWPEAIAPSPAKCLTPKQAEESAIRQ